MVKKSKKDKQELDIPVTEAAAVIETTEDVTETPKKSKKRKKEKKLNETDQNPAPQPEVKPEEVKFAEKETSHTPKSKKKKKEKQQQENKEPMVTSVTVDTDMAELPKAKKKKKKDKCSESEAVKPVVAELAAESETEDKVLFRSIEDSDLIRLPVDTKPPRAGAAKQRMKVNTQLVLSDNHFLIIQV